MYTKLKRGKIAKERIYEKQNILQVLVRFYTVTVRYAFFRNLDLFLFLFNYFSSFKESGNVGECEYTNTIY